MLPADSFATGVRQHPPADAMLGSAARAAGRAAGRTAQVLVRAQAAAARQHTGVAVPRQAAVKDGPWLPVDRRLVEVAEQAAAQATASTDIKTLPPGSALLGRSLEELQQLAEATGQPKYRGSQLRTGLLQGARSLEDITNVPKAWRQELIDRGLVTGRSTVHQTVKAKDGTRKLLLRLADGLVVEAVGIPMDDASRPRLTVCVSSQVGCPMRCTFCATGMGGFSRSLQPHEIVDQVLTVQEAFGTRVSNVVFMGMGEPLLNWRAVLHAQAMLTKEVGIGARHITISTVGVPNAIMRLAEACLQSTLAVSLHAPNQALRERLIPSARAYPLVALMEDCQAYFQKTGRRVTWEYTLMADVNDSPQLARELAQLLLRHRLHSHVNLIPWNPVAGSNFQRPSNNAVHRFAQELEQKKIPVSIRQTRGLEAAAACGQLRNDYQTVQGAAALANA